MPYFSTKVDQKYDVFLSFRGEDTRRAFVAHLHKALEGANLKTFLDDQEIETGLSLKPELESAIKASKASIIVLSKNYAISTWCLEELVLILDQHRLFDHIAIPIFYYVDPSDVRKQQNTFGDAMAEHKKKMEAEKNKKKRSQWAIKIEKWEKALTQVVDFKGKDANNYKLETQFIEEIVKDIHHKIRIPIRTRSSLPQLIGMEDSITTITSWLKDGSSLKADFLTILGMGGIGKTSLAKYVYGLSCHEFEGSSFVENISRSKEKFNELDYQRQLYNDISSIRSIQVRYDYEYTSGIQNALAGKKVFLVLDDIDSPDQLNALLGNKGFHPGSKIIITTRDAWLTESCILFKTIEPRHTKHFLHGLNETASLRLLCFHAFKSEEVKEGYEEVSDDIVKFCDGHPLALEVLGGFLYNREVTYCEDHMKELREEPGFFVDMDIRVNNALRMSIVSLSKNDKELLKHIACFFVGEDRDYAETILKMPSTYPMEE
uniref:disease resistance protein RPV1-like n=1 Tax=Erigeron canadensis TaxID=72917 RepID=UPI001CB9AEFB|nr:disease resistance protein RPV1-like [Erigeron canadensis]